MTRGDNPVRFGLVGEVKELARYVFGNIIHPDDGSVGEAGIPEPKTFSASIEEGGKSRFLPALAIAAAAVNQDPDVEPRDVFEQFLATLEERGRPLSRSDKPASTKNTIEALYEEEEGDGVPEYLEGVSIRPFSSVENDFDARLNELYTPSRDDNSVLLMPFDRNIFNTTIQLPGEVSSIPLWGVPFGVYKPSAKSDKLHVEGADMSPVSMLFRVAFPVPPGLLGHEDKGQVEDVPAAVMMRLFLSKGISRGMANMAYVVTGPEPEKG